MRIAPPAIALVLAILSPAAARAADPVARIAAYDARVNAIEKAGGGQAARAGRFEALVRDFYDMPAIAALVAGPAWAKAQGTERDAAIAALTRHSAVSLARNFKGPDATAFRVDPAPIARGGATLVKVTAGTDTLYYRFGKGGIVDVISGGVSNLALQRADLAGTLATGGVPAMTAKLKQLDGGE